MKRTAQRPGFEVQDLNQSYAMGVPGAFSLLARAGSQQAHTRLPDFELASLRESPTGQIQRPELSKF